MKLTKTLSRTNRNSTKPKESNRINAKVLNPPPSRFTISLPFPIQITSTRMTQPLVPTATLTRSESQSSTSTVSSQATFVRRDSGHSSSSLSLSSLSETSSGTKRATFDDNITNGTVYKSLALAAASAQDPEPSTCTVPAKPLAALPPLPSDLSSLSRQQLENLVQTLHQEALATRLRIQEVHAQESAHKVELETVAKRAFKSIVKLREHAAGYERELASTKAQLKDVTDKFDKVMAVLTLVVPAAMHNVPASKSLQKEAIVEKNVPVGVESSS
ncbi:hypothetical protein BCR44DRAFT_37730 [Catenaria anguillulae PL171]|uniref:Uncharacterized protein n=1 Tax=Catenaria anguillulae PL171 TaxID=765915 RepID=A0A1Y2HNX7_9FUNG|nr:hypothetical protein BCR44DRAFT_37730 [Catenaria anguillulae PL171]